MNARAPRRALAVLTMAAGLVLSPWSARAQDGFGGALPEQLQSRQTGIDQLTMSSAARRAQQRPSESSAATVNPASGDAQIAISRRNVNAPGALSEAADSRGSVAMVVGGKDRCDPASATSAQESCRDVIENRAHDFAHAETTTISPESTLLAASQRAGLGASTVGQAGTAAPTDAEQRGNQELATIVLNQQQQQTAASNSTSQPSLDANQQAIVNAVVQSLTRGN